MYLSKLRVALLCYRYYCLVPLLLAVPVCWLYIQYGEVVQVLLIKASLDALLWYFIASFHFREFYFYYNLQVSRSLLFLTWLVSDLLIFSVLLCLTALI